MRSGNIKFFTLSVDEFGYQIITSLARLRLTPLTSGWTRTLAEKEWRTDQWRKVCDCKIAIMSE